ncbi:hypothetical protein COS75_00645 [Candidatus Pacearchaeota archaeon CG06_land_8_20_14_3_00_35_12]|nr:MAG: hypothetical protein COS75_00645 [Candidatus Pacearchaeota archaeon CG06_land_8_20_14_3_00_35_12]
MSVDWKTTLPLVSVLLAVAILKWNNLAITSGFIGGIIVFAVWMTVIPLLNSMGVRAADSWLVKASIFAILAASCSLIPILLKGAFFNGVWISYVVDSAMTLSWLFAFIGGVAALMNAK